MMMVELDYLRCVFLIWDALLGSRKVYRMMMKLHASFLFVNWLLLQLTFVQSCPLLP